MTSTAYAQGTIASIEATALEIGKLQDVECLFATSRLDCANTRKCNWYRNLKGSSCFKNEVASDSAKLGNMYTVICM